MKWFLVCGFSVGFVSRWQDLISDEEKGARVCFELEKKPKKFRGKSTRKLIRGALMK
jgi:hypothetical protein